MFKTFLENILYVLYLAIFVYLGITKYSTVSNIDETPSLFLNFFVNLNNFISLYSVNILFNGTLVNLFDSLEFFFTNYYLYITLTIVTFSTIIINILNSLFFSNKLYVLYNFLINLN